MNTVFTKELIINYDLFSNPTVDIDFILCYELKLFCVSKSISGEDTDSDGCEYCGGGGNGIAGIVNSVKFFGDAINDGWSSA